MMDSPSNDQDGPSPVAPTKLDRARFFSQNIKTTAQEIIGSSTNTSLTDDEDLFEDAAFNPQLVLEDGPNSKTAGVRGKLSHTAKVAIDAVKHPRRAIRVNYTKSAAANISKQPMHDRATTYDNELLDAHDSLMQTRTKLEDSHSSRSRVELRSDAQAAELRMDQVEEQREDLKTAWILGRHVLRAKVIRLNTEKPSKQQFMSSAEKNSNSHVQWSHYLAKLVLWYTQTFTAYRIGDSDQPPFDLRELALTIERLIVITTPWQVFLAEVRKLYKWDNPRHTALYFGMYWVLWYCRHITTFAIAWIILVTIRNRFRPTKIETIRERLRRSKDQAEKAQALGELVQRHGRHDWVEPLLDQIGPHLQMSLGDLASFLEIVENYYRWERPKKTMATTFFFGCGLLMCAVTSTEFCAQLCWFAVGCVFFFGFPIATNYPRYRHLVSPLQWVFWGIPNAAELAIIKLQEKSFIRDAARLEKVNTAVAASSTQDTSDSEWYDSDDALRNQSAHSESEMPLTRIRSHDSVTFRTVLLPAHDHFKLTLTRDGIWLHDRKQRVFHEYSNLVEIRKLDLDVYASKSDLAGSGPFSRSKDIAKKMQKWTRLQFVPCGFSFIFQKQPGDINGYLCTMNEDSQEAAVMVSESDRDKIFSIVLNWSNLQWQPLFSLDRQNRLSDVDADGHRKVKGHGNQNLDDSIKKALS